MAFDPKPGLVVRYDFLWKEEERAGHIDGRKDRPCLILAVKAASQSNPVREALLCPITHSSSTGNDRAVEIPVAMARHLKLDDDRMWIKTHQINTVVWPVNELPAGLVPAHQGQSVFGQMHKQLSTQAMLNVREHARHRTLETVRREEDPTIKAFKGRMAKKRESPDKDRER